MMRITALAGLIAAAFLTPNSSTAQGITPQTVAASSTVISAPIQALNAGLLHAMHQGSVVPFQQRYQALAPVIEQTFDLQTVLAMAVGLRWKELPPDQQQALLAAFTKFTVSTYVANFDGFDGQQFIIAGTRASGDRQVVLTKLVPTSGSPAEIDYVMRDMSGKWRAVDVLLDGTISRAAVMRSDFRSLLGSGNASALIANLNQKSADLANGVQH